jgi:hypothetical protein
MSRKWEGSLPYRAGLSGEMGLVHRARAWGYLDAQRAGSARGGGFGRGDGVPRRGVAFCPILLR